MSLQHPETDPVARFAGYVATLGRGPGRSRALTRAEAADALGLVLADSVQPVQVGAFLMLLRYRGEDPDEVAGLVEAARAAIPVARGEVTIGPVTLDWPSYGAGRTRAAPWFLLSALALAASGQRVLMHGSNAFGHGLSVEQGLEALGLVPSRNAEQVREALDAGGFAYWPVRDMAPAIERLLALRTLLGLRSPINTVARLVDPGNAGVAVDGVFHPPYLSLHLAVAERLGRKSLAVIKGGGGEAERNPAKPVAAHLYADGRTRELVLPPLCRETAAPVTIDGAAFAALWRGMAIGLEREEQVVIGTIALALLALEPTRDAADVDKEAALIWQRRHPPADDTRS